MRREKRNENKENKDNKKVMSIIGFLISITLLSIAIILSMNDEKATREAKKNIVQYNQAANILALEQASTDLSKNINEIKNQNSINTVAQTEVSNNTSVSQENNTKINQTDSKQDNNKANNTSTSKSKENHVNNETKEETKVKEQFIKPVDGEITTKFSMDGLIYSNTLQEWITHRGIDIKAEKTTVVKAAADGKIKAIKEDPRYGLSIIIEHSDGFSTVYSSLLSTEFVKEGDSVKQGQSIGTVGNSAVFETLDGSHLHFEILKDNEYVNPDIYIK